jgi:ergothioneine biosynthesis protein EgtB
MSLSDKIKCVRKYSVQLCEPLETEDYVVQPVVDVSPPKWHLAHTTWFWEEFILKKFLNGYVQFHPRFSFLFNSYYNSIGDRVLRLDRGNMSRPTVNQIIEYREHVDEALKQIDLSHPDIVRLANIGIHHEQQHQELLLTDIKYILGHNPLFPVYRPQFSESGKSENDHQYLSVPGGDYRIGFEEDGFSFDNEHAAHTVRLAPFAIRKSLVTNGEYLQFMAEDGYQNPSWWLSDGWSWATENKIDRPLYWHQIDGQWYRYSLSGLKAVDLNEPVTHVSFYEATAFAEWAGERLPTEFEWEAISEQITWGLRWEHTNSAYLPYPGYQKPPGAVGEYNGKFMINQMVLRGASVATPENHSRSTYRNFFHPHLQWQFTGIRLCKR